LICEKPDIVETVGRLADLKRKRGYYWTLCPLPGHAEKTPSFKIDPERQSFHCFGCGTHGDVITFTQKYKGISFKEALIYLGIEGGKIYQPDKRALKKKELIHTFKEWCHDYFLYLCDLLIGLDRVKRKIKTEIEIEAFAAYYHRESLWNHHIEILSGNNDRAKFVLYVEVVHGN
jgi:hypothetical protein